MQSKGSLSGKLWVLRVAVPALLLLVAVAVAAKTRSLERALESPYPVARALPHNPWLAARAPLDPAEVGVVAGEPAIFFTFRSGETLGSVLAGLGLPPADSAAVVEAIAPYADPRRLRPTDSYRARLGDDARLATFEVTVASKGRASATREGEGWTGAWREFERAVEMRTLRGRLESSLEVAIVEAGGEGALAYKMSDVFQWDLDFNRDLRVGDVFEVLYERVYLDGAFDSLGAVHAAVYENRGKKLEAYRYGDPPGYFDSEGRPVRKMFLRSPLRFSRITSNFSNRRFHPILKRYRPHYGVDYGAPTGTPVRATANGVVAFAGWDGGGGRTVKVRHPNDYLTCYLHLSGIARGVRAGQRVSQGDVVGYVGATGLATAPHLDYRVQHRGRWINPLTLNRVPTRPLPESELPAFLARRDVLRDSLSTGLAPDAAGPEPTVRVAAADGPPGDPLGARGR